MKIAIAGLLIVHGLIVAAQSSGSFGSAQPIPNPAWLRWWPASLGQSWLLPGHLERTPLGMLAGVLWLAAGAALILAGLSVAGIALPLAWWRTLALIGGIISLVMLAVYLHPFFVVGIAASTTVVVGAVFTGWTILQRIGL